VSSHNASKFKTLDTESPTEPSLSGFVRDEFQLDLIKYPPDTSLFSGVDMHSLVRTKVVPWRRFGERLIYAAADRINFVPPAGHPVADANVSAIGCLPESFDAYFQTKFHKELLTAARNLPSEEYSCRNFGVSWRKPFSLIALAFLPATMVAFPAIWLNLLLVCVFLANLSTNLLRAFALMAWRRDNELPYWLPEGAARISAHRRTLDVSILVPLFREEKVLTKLVKALEALEYPHEKLEVLFLLEEADTMTAGALAEMRLPDFIKCLTVPKDWLQTKPKAMNYALPFCKGEIVGIYDAEDRPDADQLLKVVDHFLAAPANVACVQGYLDFYNSRSNWLARCFTIEYATWFRVILKGIQNIGLPIPLGGTTVFFRRSILEEVGGWDAHNVTEDADLGIRIARLGYRCEMVNTTTWEEANNVPLAWIRQRSRWLKGFAMTWISHMRDPSRLLKDLGPAGFVSFHVVLLGGISAFLAAPLFWLLWLAHFSIPVIPMDMIPVGLWWVFLLALTGGQFVTLSAMFLATSQQHLRHLMPYILTLPLYWPLGAFAAYKAIVELFFAPFYWDKTHHGLDDEP